MELLTYDCLSRVAVSLILKNSLYFPIRPLEFVQPIDRFSALLTSAVPVHCRATDLGS